ncbi:MAG TPA: ABC transporter substrate-binding protein [Nocardioides sp.]|uniref:ABC transporter substrate-binding protein n=1 Tax=Nocardioides sp. TaxID=35761 RepID=UPI002D181424|nr:ABC transporter substrate-binding protein [Nocardioides sp.]HTW15628.1 ABC transporter substrate-binding protein [Nocardioides sp.]
MKQFARLARVAVPATALALALAACGGGSDEDGAEGTSVLRVSWGGFPESWAPGADIEAGYQRVPYEYLTQLGPGNEVQPMLAESWEQTDSDITLTLQEGVTFHDGTPFDAEAVKANIELVKDTPGPYAGPFQVVESVEVVDARTVKINLKAPAPSLLTTLSTRAGAMASPAAIADGSIATTPVGTGPWKYDAATSISGTRMDFTAFEDYWDEVPAYDQVQLFAIEEDNAASAAMSNGEIDITDTELDQESTLEGIGSVEIIRYPAIRLNPLFFDRGPGGAFEDVNVRRAACHAMDTEVVTKLEGDVRSATQHFAEGEPGHNPEVTGYEHDLAEAERLLAEAGNPDVSVQMMAATFNERQLSVYAEQMSEAGIEVKLQTAPPPQFFAEWLSPRYGLGVGSNDELTPYDWYSAWFAADAPGNPSGVESDELKAAADAAIAAGATDEAEALWQDVVKVIADEALTCAHTVGDELVAVNTAEVSGASEPSQPYEPMNINYRDLAPAGS